MSSTPSARKLRVLTMVDSLDELGGAELLAVEIATRLDRQRFEPYVCVTRDSSGPLVERVRAAGIPLLRLRRTSRRTFWRWWRLVALLRRERIDVVHSHMVGSNVWGAVFGRLAGVPAIVAHEHTWSYEGELLRRLLDRHVVAHGSDVILAVSEADRERMTSIEGIPPTKTLAVANGIAELPAPGGRDFRGELGLGTGTRLVGTVARLDSQKALDVLVRAVAQLAAEGRDVHVALAGSGEREDALRGLADETGVAGRTHFVGRLAPTEVVDLLGALDVVVNSSDFEGSSLAILEWMAAGKPIVATAVGGTPDLVSDGEHALLVPPQDVDALAHAIARLLDDGELAARLGAAARERQRSEFTLDRMVRRLEEIYERLYAESRRR